MFVSVFTALAIAGFPLSGGALAKLAIKGSLGEGIVAWLVTLSAVGTAMLMLRFLRALGRLPARTPSEGRAFGLLAPWLAMAGAALALSRLLFPMLSGHSWSYAASPANHLSALWPVLLVPLLLMILRIDRKRDLTIACRYAATAWDVSGRHFHGRRSSNRLIG